VVINGVTFLRSKHGNLVLTPHKTPSKFLTKRARGSVRKYEATPNAERLQKSISVGTLRRGTYRSLTKSFKKKASYCRFYNHGTV